jgi:hypothetical protein
MGTQKETQRKGKIPSDRGKRRKGEAIRPCHFVLRASIAFDPSRSTSVDPLTDPGRLASSPRASSIASRVLSAKFVTSCEDEVYPLLSIGGSTARGRH